MSIRIPSSFRSIEDEFSGGGKRPVIFDVLGPDEETSIFPDETKLVLHANPESMKFSYAKEIQRIQTKGGYVEQHWGEAADSISFDGTTGGFVRLYTGLSNITGGGIDAGGTRRETIAYDKYLDYLALFHNNAAIYDSQGNLAFQGVIKITFDGGSYFGWFNNFSVSESSDKPYQFSLSTNFTITREIWSLRSAAYSLVDSTSTGIDQTQLVSDQGFDPFNLISF